MNFTKPDWYEPQHGYAGLMILGIVGLSIGGTELLKDRGAATRIVALDKGSVKAAVNELPALHVALSKQDRLFVKASELTASSGAVKAGEYAIRVRDRSSKRAVTLTGPGVHRSSGEATTGRLIWTVTLKPGAYRFQSGKLAKTFTVS